MKFGMNARTNTPYPAAAGVMKMANGECYFIENPVASL